MSERVLILSADFGAGHIQAARAIAEACERNFPGCVAEAVNVKTPFAGAATAGYLRLLRHAPGAYRSLYHAPVPTPLRALIRSAYSHAVGAEVLRFRPTILAATHPFPGSAAAGLRVEGLLRLPLAMVVTDFVPHPLWAVEGVEQYFVASTEAAAALEALGVNTGRVAVSGIPIRAGFRAQIKTRPAAGRILIMGGGLGLGPVVEAVRSCAERPERDLRVTVVCGENLGLYRELTDLFGTDPRVEVLGYTDRVADLMAEADLLVTKPGGLSCSEALACGLPLLLLRPLPGQEEENARCMARTGAAVIVDEESAGSTAAGLLFGPPARLEAMRSAAYGAGRPDSASEIAHTLLIQPALCAD